MKIAQYGSSLTDAQWEYVQPMLPKPSKRGRPRTDLRQVLDANQLSRIVVRAAQVVNRARGRR